MKSSKDSGPSSCWITSGVHVANGIGKTYGWLSRVGRLEDETFAPVPHKAPIVRWKHSLGRVRTFL